MISVPVITIDGPTASGKGTVAQKVARLLGFHYLDSGVLYRATALAGMHHAVDVGDIETLSVLASGLELKFEDSKIFLSGENITHSIRAESVGHYASVIATYGPIRQLLLNYQRSFCREPGLVADGRDMGTKVFPEAILKIYLIANAQTRAQRRYQQLLEKGFSANIENILRDLEERDRRDAMRSESPLRAAENAHILDASALTVDETVGQVLQWWQKVPGFCAQAVD